LIKKRLLCEGDSGTDDRKISSLLKSFLSWTSGTETGPESNHSFEKLQSNLAIVEFNFAKSNLVYEMNLKEDEEYSKLYATIEDELHKAVTKINDCKTELDKAKVMRKNLQEYDALARIINEHPDRQATIDGIAVLEKEHNDLKAMNEKLDQKLEQRKRNFHLLVTSIHQLQSLLDKDDDSDLDEATEDISFMPLTSDEVTEDISLGPVNSEVTDATSKNLQGESEGMDTA